MMIKPIRTEEDYDEAMSRIDELIDAEPGTPEFNELEVLSVLSQAYEEKNYPIDAPDPAEALKCIMEWKKLERSDLEHYIGTKKIVSKILNHERSLTPDMIIRLEKGLGIPADILTPDADEEFPISIRERRIPRNKEKLPPAHPAKFCLRNFSCP